MSFMRRLALFCAIIILLLGGAFTWLGSQDRGTAPGVALDVLGATVAAALIAYIFIRSVGWVFTGRW